MNISTLIDIDNKVANLLLLVAILSTIILLPLGANSEYFLLYLKICYTLLLIFSLLVLEKVNNTVSIAVILLIAVQWMAATLEWKFISDLIGAFFIILFVFTVINLIMQIAGAVKINSLVIIEAINGYLLIGLMFAIVVQFIIASDPSAYYTGVGADKAINDMASHGGSIYYTYSALTTAGYGDIVPISPIARSTSIIISISGQLYLAIIVALIMGKFANSKRNEN